MFLLILLQIVLIGLNAVFACAEIAVISINDAKLNHMAGEGDKRAIRLKKLTSQPARFLATIQVAITLSGFIGSAFAAENFSDPIVDWLIGLGLSISRSTLNTISVLIITIILSYLTLVFGELVPKRVAMRKAESLALGMSKFISAISKLFAPIVWLLTASTNGILRLMGIDPNAEDEEIGEEEIRMMVDVGSEKGTIDHQEKEFIQNVFEFDDLTAGEIAKHRVDVDYLWLEDEVSVWDKEINASRHTRYPVCGETADDVKGVLNTKDYFALSDKSKNSILKQAVKQPYFVPESVKADVLFRNMKISRNQFAIVLDEYGGMTGIITMSDLIEQLVGDIGDEMLEEPDIVKIDGNTWRIRGGAQIDDIEKALGIHISGEDIDTLNGLIFSSLGAIPEDDAGVEVETSGLMIKVEKMLEHRVESAIVCLTSPKTDDMEKTI